MVVISSGQLLPAQSAALHHRSYQSRSSEGVLRSVEIDVPDIYLTFKAVPQETLQYDAEERSVAQCWQHVAITQQVLSFCWRSVVDLRITSQSSDASYI